MKFLAFITYDGDKMAEVAAASDKFWANPPPGLRLLAAYGALGIPLPGVVLPPHSGLAVCVIEADSAELLWASCQPAWGVGGSACFVPAIEVPVTDVTGAVKNLEGYQTS